MNTCTFFWEVGNIRNMPERPLGVQLTFDPLSIGFGYTISVSSEGDEPPECRDRTSAHWLK